MTLPLALLTLFGALLLVEALRSHWRLARAAAPMPEPSQPVDTPPVSVIRPIRGMDVGATENIAAALGHGYPGEVETLFVFDDDDEPALPLVREAIARLPRRERDRVHVLFCGSPPPGQTGKLNAMITGLARARHDVIVFADSDIRPDAETLSTLVQTLLIRPDNGSAFAPVVVSSPVITAGDAGYAMLLNGLYGPAAYLTMRRAGGRSSFIMGQFMALRRSAIETIGGLEALAGEFVDDMALGELITEAGLRNQLAPRPVPIIQSRLSFPAFWKVYRRWLAFGRSGLRGGAGSIKRISAYRGALFALGLVLGVAALAEGAVAPGLLGLAAALVVTWSIGAHHLRLGGAPLRPHHRLMAAFLLLSAPVIYLANHVRGDVDWRGRSYRLDHAARLADRPQPVSREAPDGGPLGSGRAA